jgi:hypothetical protein
VVASSTPAAATTLSASAQTSGPMPSPPMTAIRLPVVPCPTVLFLPSFSSIGLVMVW